MEVCYDPSSKVIADARPIRHVPLVGEVAAGTGVLAQENVEELYPLPEDFTGTGTLFMVKVRGDSMIEAGIMDGDCVVVRQQPDAEQGDVVVAGIPDGEATVKHFSRRDGRVILTPANQRLEPMEFDPDEVTVYGKVVTVLRRL
jgi:repressor LexA